MNQKKFKPQIIGKPDLKTRDEILNRAGDVLTGMSSLFVTLQELFPDSKTSFDELKYYIESEKPEKFLKRKFIVDQEIQVKGIKIDALVETDLLDVPKSDFEIAIEQRLFIQEDLSRISPFYSPIAYMQMDENFTITIKKEYIEKVEANTQEVTQNEYQNQVLAHIESVRDSLNALIELNAISPRAGTKQMLFRFGDAFMRNRFEHIPTEIDPNIFRVNTIPPLKRPRIGQHM